MVQTTAPHDALETMPRGGPNASWLDRHLQTTRLEYTDRYDVPDEVKQTVVAALDWLGTRTRQHEANARLALAAVADIPNPRILELGSGHGKLSEEILRQHPSATVTASDLDPKSVANIAAGPLGTNPRARIEVVDATAIDAADDSYDLVVFAQAFHHLPPATGARAIAEATRVGSRFLVIDLPRTRPLSMLASLLAVVPVAAVLAVVRPALNRGIHDGVISMLRAYSAEAFTALAAAADPSLRVDFLPPPSYRFGTKNVAVVFWRPDR
ncbi:class I SAM-dependent methyltransferase [Mycobacterium sp. M26]|uniref:class I SAM-dependent methyltransferase n=1 Tax=Mycobacterium sp. M26 TaxID=1762962 RepID=UPI00073E9833|nr:class I SAM-dependent methyltransferase [Mycobacterium sp. M26]